MREAVFKAWRIDGRVMQTQIGTNRGSNHAPHLFRLFEEKIRDFEPGPGIELFTIDAPKTEEVSPLAKDVLDRDLAARTIRASPNLPTESAISWGRADHRYLPAEHYWPERACPRPADFERSLYGVAGGPAPAHPFLAAPERIEVAAPSPIIRPCISGIRTSCIRSCVPTGRSGSSRSGGSMERRHRDYYVVEDETGARYWLFRSGHYTGDHSNQWYLHGFFA